MNRRNLYFLKQKLMGVGIIALTLLPLMLFRGEDATYAVLLIPMGLWLIFSKKMILVNDYFFEMEDYEDEDEEF